MNIRSGFFIFLSVLLISMAVSCSPANYDSDDSEFSNFDIKNYMETSKYSDFSFTKILRYTENSIGSNLNYISSMALSISDEDYVSEFSVSSHTDQNSRPINSSYRECVFKIKFIDGDQDLETTLESSILEDIDNLISSKSFEELGISSLYLISELSLDNIDYSYLSSYDLYLYSDNQLSESTEDKIRPIDNPIVFSALKEDQDNPIYIIIKK